MMMREKMHDLAEKHCEELDIYELRDLIIRECIMDTGAHIYLDGLLDGIELARGEG